MALTTVNGNDVVIGAMPDFERRLRQRRRDDGDGDSAQTVGGGMGSAGRRGSSFRFKSSTDSFDLNLTSSCSYVSHPSQKKVSTIMLSLQLCLPLEMA